MKFLRLKYLIALFFLWSAGVLPMLANAEEIDVLIKGVDDGVKTNKQQDYNEAVMNAKLQAIERAGVEISSITKVENFQLKYDMVESKAKALLLPGFQIMDMGYQVDGTYQVVLVGKVKTGDDKAKIIKGNLKIIFKGIIAFFAQQKDARWAGDPNTRFYSCYSILTANPIDIYLRAEDSLKGELVNQIDYGSNLQYINEGCGSAIRYADTIKNCSFPHCLNKNEFGLKIRKEITIPVVAGKKYILWLYTGIDYLDGKLVSRPFMLQVPPDVLEKTIIINETNLLLVPGIALPANLALGDTVSIEEEGLGTLFKNNPNYKPTVIFFVLKSDVDPRTFY